MIKYQDFPLKQNKDVEHVYKQIRGYVVKNKHLIIIAKDDNFEIRLRGLHRNSKFYFHVGDPKLNTSNNNTINYTIEFAPKNSVSTAVNRQNVVSESVLKVLNMWIGMLESYNNLNVHPEDSISDQYEDEFEDWFEIVDEDAGTNAFDSQRQILIANVITMSIEALLEEGFSEKDELIQEAAELKKDISRLTKKQAFNSIKSIYAKLKIKGGMDKVNLIYEVCEKEVIKMGFHIGTKMLGQKLVNLIDNIVS